MKTLILTATLAFMGAGCIVRDHGHGHGPAPARVVVDRGHHHDDHCGHYYHHDGYWSHAHGHRHGAGCGHHYRSGMWITIR